MRKEVVFALILVLFLVQACSQTSCGDGICDVSEKDSCLQDCMNQPDMHVSSIMIADETYVGRWANPSWEITNTGYGAAKYKLSVAVYKLIDGSEELIEAKELESEILKVGEKRVHDSQLYITTPGVYKYSVAVSVLGDDRNLLNNHAQAYFEAQSGAFDVKLQGSNQQILFEDQKEPMNFPDILVERDIGNMDYLSSLKYKGGPEFINSDNSLSFDASYINPKDKYSAEAIVTQYPLDSEIIINQVYGNHYFDSWDKRQYGKNWYYSVGFEDTEKDYSSSTINMVWTSSNNLLILSGTSYSDTGSFSSDMKSLLEAYLVNYPSSLSFPELENYKCTTGAQNLECLHVSAVDSGALDHFNFIFSNKGDSKIEIDSAFVRFGAETCSIEGIDLSLLQGEKMIVSIPCMQGFPKSEPIKGTLELKFLESGSLATHLGEIIVRPEK